MLKSAPVMPLQEMRKVPNKRHWELGVGGGKEERELRKQSSRESKEILLRRNFGGPAREMHILRV